MKKIFILAMLLLSITASAQDTIVKQETNVVQIDTTTHKAKNGNGFARFMNKIAYKPAPLTQEQRIELKVRLAVYRAEERLRNRRR